MARRSALIGPIQDLRATTVAEAANVAPFLEELDYLNVPDLWYSTSIQSGVESLEVIPLSGERNRFSPFLHERIEYPRDPNVNRIFALVSLALSPAVSSDDKMPKELRDLHNFLVELLLAAHRKRNLIYFDRLPDIESLSSLLPLALLLPIRNLFSAITHSTPVVATSQSSVTFQEIALFEELISSKAFRQYEQSHSAFDDNTKSPQIAIDSVTRVNYWWRGVRVCSKQNALRFRCCQSPQK